MCLGMGVGVEVNGVEIGRLNVGNTEKSNVCEAERQCWESCNSKLWELSQEEKLVILHVEGRRNS